MFALPLKSYGQLGLDSVTNFAVYAEDTLTVNGTPATTVNGDVGLGGPNGMQNFGSAFTINGTYRVDSSANNNNTYNDANFTGHTVTQSLAYVTATVNGVSTDAASLPSTTHDPGLTSSTLLNTNYLFVGNSGTNVIDVGTISLNGNKHLTLQGGPNDYFVFNVSNYATFLQVGSTPIVLSGVATNHVLFNLLNTSAGANALTSTGGVTLLGTFIAPDASMDIMNLGGSDTIYGGVFAGGSTLTINSGTITADVFMLPEPSSFALVGISCLFSLGLWSRRRTRR
jgi:hypothetical protein